uniref:Ribosomal protein L5 n=1 Tax=Trebouxiophyceae sp. MX-AZ01 TaxID=1208065 RepID=J7KEG2_9CHLO|nr:ribosomal protein L5 [Trebouxiophyceae sp. MX-AZ01]AFQ93760.1 ribosomal protein L5 [Trebouxiophyceae sp. MX-AZ01]
MGLPSLKKVVINYNSKAVVRDKRGLLVGVSALLMVSGQRPATTWARKSIAGFKIREGDLLGCKVTLRRRLMYTFLDRLISVALPRARPSLLCGGLDRRGVYTIGVGDPFQFYELEHHYDLLQSLQGFDVALLTSKGRRMPPLVHSPDASRRNATASPSDAPASRRDIIPALHHKVMHQAASTQERSMAALVWSSLQLVVGEGSP